MAMLYDHFINHYCYYYYYYYFYFYYYHYHYYYQFIIIIIIINIIKKFVYSLTYTLKNKRS